MVKPHGIKHEFVRETSEQLRKSKREIIRIPEDKYKEVKLALNEMDLSFQKVFDYCVIGGLVLRKPEMIEFIRKHVGKYKKASQMEKGNRFHVKRTGPRLKDISHNVYVQTYEYDFTAFNNYVIDENIKKTWVYYCIFFDGILARAPEILEMIERNKSMNVHKRKQAVARLAKDPFVLALSEAESNKLMDLFTQEYEEKKYDSSLYPETIAKNIDWEESDEDKKLDEDLKALFQKRRVAHNRINKLLEPIDEAE